LDLNNLPSDQLATELQFSTAAIPSGCAGDCASIPGLESEMTMNCKRFLGIIPLLVVAATIPEVHAQQSLKVAKAAQIVGLPGVKENAKGTLSVENGNLHFVHNKGVAEVSAASIRDVVASTDSKKAVGKTVGTISMAAPYGGGRFLSLFRKRIDTLAVEYRDVDGALHGLIFTIPSGKAEAIKTELIASGAHTKATTDQSTTAQPSTSSLSTEEKQ